MVSPVFLLCCLLVAASATYVNLQQAWDLVKEEFDAFKLQYNKTYSSELEEQIRLQNFLHNRQQIARHNTRHAHGLVSFTLGINKYSDMLHHEFITTHTSFNKKRLNAETLSMLRGATFIQAPENVMVPEVVDWRKSGAVTPVKDQGFCGACWAFGATGSLEGQQFRKTGKLVSLSEQNLIDCSGLYGNDGCDGGSVNSAFQYIRDNGGINTEDSYPYMAEKGWCKYDPENSGASIFGFMSIPEGDEGSLEVALATVGPVAVVVDASSDTFDQYRGGVYYEPRCRTSLDDVSHAMLVVGYGTDPDGGDYWLIKNSWGTDWGMDGYMKLARNRQNHCAVATSATFPLV